MATIFPILISLGVSKVSAAAVLITIGMLDMGPNDSSAIFGATEVMGISPMDYFMNYEILVGGSVILIMAVFYAVYFKYMDKKEYGETKTGSGGIVEFSPKDFGIPVFYGISLPSLDNPFYADIVRGAKSGATRHGYHLIINESHINHNTLCRESTSDWSIRPEFQHSMR